MHSPVFLLARTAAAQDGTGHRGDGGVICGERGKEGCREGLDSCSPIVDDSAAATHLKVDDSLSAVVADARGFFLVAVVIFGTTLVAITARLVALALRLKALGCDQPSQ